MGLTINWNKYVNKWVRYKEFVHFLNSNYMKSVLTYLSQEYKKYSIHPKKSEIFKSFYLCDPDKLKVVILGVEPISNNSSNGLAFGNKSINYDPILNVISKAVELDVYDGFKLDFDPTLESWAKQGVLLLNTSLTSVSGKINAHNKIWDKFIKFIIDFISETFPGTIFLLWGAEAQKYEIINNKNINNSCYVLKYSHPLLSIINKKDWKCNNFSKVNELITKNNGSEYIIKW